MDTGTGQRIRSRRRIGAHGMRETPVPIPNTEVKPHSGYNTWPIKAWENSTVPNYAQKPPYGGFLLLGGEHPLLTRGVLGSRTPAVLP